MEAAKIFRRTQLIVGSVFFLFILLKSLKVPLMGPFIVVSGGLLSLLLFGLMFFTLITKWKISKGIALLLFFINLTSYFALIGIFFSVMFWPFGLVMVVFGFIVFSWIVPPGFFYYLIKGRKREDFWRLLRFDLIKTIILISFGAFIFFLGKDKRIDIFSAHPEKTRETLRKQEMEEQIHMEKRGRNTNSFLRPLKSLRSVIY